MKKTDTYDAVVWLVLTLWFSVGIWQLFGFWWAFTLLPITGIAIARNVG